MKKLFLAIPLIFLFQFTGCPSENVKSVSAKIDKSLIPILYHIHYAEFFEADLLVKDVQRKWNINKVFLNAEKKYSDDFGTLPEYVESHLRFLSYYIQQEDAYHAKDVFHTIHCALSEFRAEQGVDYYLDELMEFYYETELLLDTAQDPLLDLHDWDELEWRYDYMIGMFYFISKSPSDLNEFRVDVRNFDMQLEDINDALLLLGECFEEADREQVASAADLLHTHVLNTLVLFTPSLLEVSASK